MFFAALIAAPIAAGLVAGLASGSRRLPLALGTISVALGIAGAVVIGVDASTTDRPAAVAFALVAGVVGALLAYGGWYAGREGRRRTAKAAG